MNNKLLIGFFVALAVVLGLPLVSQVQRGAPTAPAAVPVPAERVSPPVPQQQPAPPPAPRPQAQAPRLPTAADLVGTAWEMKTPEGAVQVQLNQGGQAIASHPMVGNLNATWRVSGSRLTVKATFMGQSQTVTCEIGPEALWYNGQPVRRLR